MSGIVIPQDLHLSPSLAGWLGVVVVGLLILSLMARELAANAEGGWRSASRALLVVIAPLLGVSGLVLLSALLELWQRWLASR